MIRKNKGINEIVVMSSNVDIGILSLAKSKAPSKTHMRDKEMVGKGSRRKSLRDWKSRRGFHLREKDDIRLRRLQELFKDSYCLGFSQPFAVTCDDLHWIVSLTVQGRCF